MAGQLQKFMPRVQQVVEQTKRHVLQGEAVPAGEKLVSLFEPESAVIRKGKLTKPVEYGRTEWLDEVEGGIFSRYEVLAGNLSDHLQLQPAIEQHKKLFKRPPCLIAADLGCWSPENEAVKAVGIAEICLPFRSGKNAKRQKHEAQA